MNTTTEQPVSSFWSRLGGSLLRAGTASFSWAKDRYEGIAPEFRTHLGEAPLLALTLLAPGKTPKLSLPDDGQRLVVFVHGLAGHRGNFLPMQSYFGWLGRSRTVSIGFPNRNSIEEMAEHLATSIEALARENQLEGKSIDIVAHSMGGIITRLALRDPELASRIHTVITLATPHHGTQLARYLDTMKVRELQPGSKLLGELSCQLPWGRDPLMPRLICFWTPKDLVLLPPRSAVVDGAEEVCVPESTHLGFMLKPVVWEQVFRILTPELLETRVA
jgi:triacylglycerol esterase/lipase EstA (alpha/beta hydrolase family)